MDTPPETLYMFHAKLRLGFPAAISPRLHSRVSAKVDITKKQKFTTTSIQANK
jgi:hypothetical protein